jgi:uncharacterized protein (DUF1330 family)
MDKKYLEPTQESGAHLFSKNIQGEVTMLNLLKFRKIADYSENPELDTGDQISGKDAYKKYMDETLAFLEESGGKIIFEGECDRFLIGPENEEWDYMLLIRQSSLQSFLSFASNPAYLKVLGHRTAALEDSRLLPIFDKQI